MSFWGLQWVQSSSRPAGHTGDLGGLPATILLAADQGQVALGQPLPALVTKHGVYFIAQPWAAKHLSQGQLWWRPTGHQPHLAGVGQVVVAGYITPLSLIMPHHDHAVLSGQEVAVRLPRIPVLIEQGDAI